MKIEYLPADEKSAREFLRWKYEPPYDIYNCPSGELEKSVQYNIDPANNVYALFGQDDELIGYCSYGSDAQVPGGNYSKVALDIGLMVKPELTGHGMGSQFAIDIIRYGIEKYAPKLLRVTIAAFNKRAIHTWEKIGFQHIQTFKRDSDGIEFIIMTKEIKP